MRNRDLKLKAEQLRLRLIKLIHEAGTGHTGGDLSVLNVLTVLYYKVLRVDPAHPKWADRDRFVLSKGHCAEALYCVLNDKGFIGDTDMEAYGKEYAHLGGHPDMSIRGVEISSGALGHGLSVGVGMALAAKMDGKDRRTFVVMGDGEQAEGSIYEAAMAAHKFELDHLVAVIDRNGLQISGSTEDVMPLEPISERWSVFGWDVKEMCGDDIDSIVDTIQGIDYHIRRPHLLISRSTKGLGVSFMENVAKWHHGVPSEEQYVQAVGDIEARLKAIEESY
ncbi:MAG: transketolase [Prevotella sp.]|nr:transketolase [Prevotella sp.]